MKGWIERYGVLRNQDGGSGGGGEGGGQQGQQGGGQQQGQQGQQQQTPWFKSPDYGFDGDTLKFYEGKNFPDVKTALASLPHADRMARERNVLPMPDADPAKRAEWDGWEKLGWVKDPAQYAAKAPDQKRAGELGIGQYDQSFWNDMAKAAHELRIPLDAFQALHDKALEVTGQRITEARGKGAKALADLEAALKNEWGNEYAARKERAQNAAAALLSMDDAAALNRVTGDIGLLQFFDRLAGMLGEDTIKGLSGGGSLNAQNAAAAKAERMKLEADPNWMKVFNDPRHPQNKAYVAQRQRLLNIEAGG